MNRLATLVASALALGCLAATPTPKPGPKATPKPAAKTPATPKATPKATAKVVATPAPSPTPEAPSVMEGERKVAEGKASWKLGKNEHQGTASGSIQTSSGFKIAILDFPAGKKEKLHLEFMYTGAGPVDQGYLTRVFAVDGDGRYHAWKKGIGDCSLELAKASAVEVEGTLNCPKGLLDLEDKPAKPITEAKFKVKTDPKPVPAPTWAP